MRLFLKNLAEDIIPFRKDFENKVGYKTESYPLVYNYIYNSRKAREFIDKYIEKQNEIFKNSCKIVLSKDDFVKYIDLIRAEINKPSSKFRIFISDRIMDIHNIIDWICVRRAYKKMNRVSELFIKGEELTSEDERLVLKMIEFPDGSIKKITK